MKIALGQINSTIGAFEKNRQKIIDLTVQAKKQHADLVLFPELSVCGYPPMDLLDQDSFTEQNIRSIRILQQELPPDIAVGIGFVNRTPYAHGKSLVNEYGIIYNGKLVFEQNKTLLPTYDVFDEARNFEPAQNWNTFDFQGERIGIAICEDVWLATDIPGTSYRIDPVRKLLNDGATVLCVPSASPFTAGKHQVRLELAERIALRGNVSVVYVNAVGANDQIVFDGRSFVLRGNGTAVCGAKAFEEDLIVFSDSEECVCNLPPALGRLQEIESALVLGIREYMAKCGFLRCHLGLSGGIDSALVAYLAVQAVGKENVVCISMPSRFSSQGSKDDAEELAKNLGCRYETLPIEPVFERFQETLRPVFEDRPFNIAEENLQARIRGTLLMAFSNKFDSILLTTGNKSELAMGYCTLYGDMNGALAVIGDLLKTEVFALCRYINEQNNNVIPEAILTKPPSAELRPNQTDQDSLPPYELLDEILKWYLYSNLSATEIAARGYDLALAQRVVKSAAGAEFKRRQAPPVLKVSQRAFGMGRRLPIARAVCEG
ncbi:NAD+ synthase [Planctomycetales bacterium]|nr:NAD+ synthase [Planctomycetales bacterium]